MNQRLQSAVPTDLLFVRHGESVANRRGVWQGSSEGDLTSLGLRQAELVAARLVAWESSIGRLYSSPLRRAWQTAEAIAQRLGLEIVADSGLGEIDLGEVNGLSVEEFAARFPELYAQWQDRSDLSYTWPGGEERRAFFQRVRGAVDEIVRRHAGETVVLVTHGGTIRAALAGLVGGAWEAWWTYGMDNASISHARVEPGGGPEILSVNDVAHLVPLREEG